MTNTYFATALVGGGSVGVTIRAENISSAFEVAEDYLQERHPRSEVVIQAIQRIKNEFSGSHGAASYKGLFTNVKTPTLDPMARVAS